MDASNDFGKAKNQNNLNDQNIDKIINTFKERKNLDFW
ncbi:MULTISPECIES: N-6 DNA methylase [Clostridium]